MAWLQKTKPLCKTSFFQSIGLCPPPLNARTDGKTTKPASSAAQTRISPMSETSSWHHVDPEIQPAKPVSETTPKSAVISLGYRLEGGGIPAIVLDTNNDLARLGEAWPSRPTAFSDDDAQRAQHYKQMVEVVVCARISGRQGA
jgi:hypothetical protein